MSYAESTEKNGVGTPFHAPEMNALRPEELYLLNNLQILSVPSLEEIANSAGVQPQELPQAMQKMALEIADVTRNTFFTVEEGYEKRIDFIYRCWAATRDLPEGHQLYTFARSLDSLDTFIQTYLPDATNRLKGDLIERVTGFVEEVVHPSSDLHLYPKERGWSKASTFGIYTIDGDWIHIPGQYYHEKYVEKQVVEEALRLKKENLLHPDEMYHATGSSILEGVARQKAILSTQRAHQKGESVQTGEYATYINRHDDKPVGYSNTVYAGDCMEVTYGKSIWFDEFRMVFGISRSKMANFLRQSGRTPDFKYRSEIGITLGPEVPLDTITSVYADSRHKERVEEWIKRNGLQEQMRFISLEAVSLAREYSDRNLGNLLTSPIIKLPDILEPKSDTQKLNVTTMEKVGHQMGTNLGGVYKDRETGLDYYIKRYSDRSQASCEWIANRIYKASGAPVLTGVLIPDGDSIAYATLFRQDFRKLPPERRKEAQSVFVAACYLLDWDAIGVGPENPYGNLQVDNQGQFQLVDHGGSLLFRGMHRYGKSTRKNPSDLNPSAVGELESMRTGINPISQEIFQGINPGEIRKQAHMLIQQVTPEFINSIVDQSGMNSVDARQVKDLLVGRRNALIQRFGTPR